MYWTFPQNWIFFIVLKFIHFCSMHLVGLILLYVFRNCLLSTCKVHLSLILKLTFTLFSAMLKFLLFCLPDSFLTKLTGVLVNSIWLDFAVWPRLCLYIRKFSPFTFSTMTDNLLHSLYMTLVLLFILHLGFLFHNFSVVSLPFV